MRTFDVTLGKGGSGTMTIEVRAATPDEARRIAEHMYPGYRAQSVRNVY